MKIIIDQVINFERPSGYVPNSYITVDDEIKDICDKERILVGNIIKVDSYKVYCSKKIKNKDTYKKAKKALENL